MGAPIAAFLTLVLSLLLLRRLVFRPVVPGMDANLLDGAAIAALNRDRKQQLEQRRTTEAAQGAGGVAQHAPTGQRAPQMARATQPRFRCGAPAGDARSPALG